MSWSFVAFRMPGTDSPDFAAARILATWSASQRADLYGLVPEGKALGTEFGLAETYPKASVGLRAGGNPGGADPAPITAEMKTILSGYADKGVPPGTGGGGEKGRNRGRGVPTEFHPRPGIQLVAGAGRRRPQFAHGHCRRHEEGHGGGRQSRGEDIPDDVRPQSSRR